MMPTLEEAQKLLRVAKADRDAFIAFTSHTQWVKAPKQVQDGATLYAIGDVHGHAVELQALHAVIRAEIEANLDSIPTVIHLGDYIDRGPDSKQTLKILANCDFNRCEKVFLIGNHEQFMIELLALNPELDRQFITAWYDNGGIETMCSLGVEGYGRLVEAGDFAELRTRVQAALGSHLEAFFNRLKPFVRFGDYVFVHAGINPNVGLEQQEFTDLLLMREPFLSADRKWNHTFCVVHGHSISTPSVHKHRISVDAGCYRTGVLCAAQLKEDKVRFLGVMCDPGYSWKDKMSGRNPVWEWSEPIPVVAG